MHKKLLIFMMVIAGNGLLAMQPEIDEDEKQQHKAFVAAMQGKSSERIRALIKQGKNVHARSGNSETPLHFAAQFSRLEIARIFIENGADVNCVDMIGRTPLIKAIHSDNVKMIELLIANGANVSHATGDGISCLMNSAMGSVPYICKMLIENGADIFATDQLGATALMWGAQGGYCAVVHELLTIIPPIETQKTQEQIPVFMGIHFANALFPRDIRKLLAQALTDSLVEDHMCEIERLIAHQDNNDYDARRWALDGQHHEILQMLDFSIPASRGAIQRQVRNNIKRILFGEPRQRADYDQTLN